MRLVLKPTLTSNNPAGTSAARVVAVAAFAAGLVTLPAGAALPVPERCLRAVGAADVSIDLKRDELSIAVTNLRGNCDVIVNDMGMFGAKNDIVNFTEFG